MKNIPLCLVFVAFHLVGFAQDSKVNSEWLKMKYSGPRIFDNSFYEWVKKKQPEFERISHAELSRFKVGEYSLMSFSDTNSADIYFLGSLDLADSINAILILTVKKNNCGKMTTAYYCILENDSPKYLHTLYNRTDNCFFDFEICSALYDEGLISYNLSLMTEEFNPHNPNVTFSEVSIVLDSVSDGNRVLQDYNYLSTLNISTVLKGKLRSEQIKFSIPLKFVYADQLLKNSIDVFSRKNNVQSDVRYIGKSKSGALVIFIGKDSRDTSFVASYKNGKIKYRRIS